MMARIRTIKPEFWTSEEVTACGPLARLFFIGLWSFADDGGNHPVQISGLKAKIFPLDSEINSTTVRRMLGELAVNTLLTFYQAADGKQYFHITGWKHQKIDKPSFKYLKPTDVGSKFIGFNDLTEKIRLPSPEIARSSPADILSSEGKGLDLTSESSPTTELKLETPSASSAIAHRDFFDEFWNAYPRNEEKKKAKAAYSKARKRASHEQIMAGVERMKASRTDPKYFPYAVRFLNNDRWTEDWAGPPSKDSEARDFAKVFAEGEIKDAFPAHDAIDRLVEAVALPAPAGVVRKAGED